MSNGNANEKNTALAAEGNNTGACQADVYNVVLKQAKKRALVDAVLTATAASDHFTQDLEDLSSVVEVAKTAGVSKTAEVPKPAVLIKASPGSPSPSPAPTSRQ